MIDKDQVSITDACCVRIIHARWNAVNAEIYSKASRTYYDLPTRGAVPFLSSSKLRSIRHDHQYDIKLMASFLGSTYVIPLLNHSTAASSGHSEYDVVREAVAGPSTEGTSRAPRVSSPKRSPTD